MKRVNKNSKLSCNQQLKEILRETIRKNRNNADYTIPSEEKLCSFHDLARGTVRKAITELVEEGLLIKRPGKGTFINTSINDDSTISSTGGLIALVIKLGPEANTTFGLVRGIEKVISDQGYFLILKSLAFDTKGEEIILDVLSKRCEGLIVYSVAGEGIRPVYQGLLKRNYPFVMVDRYFPDLATDWVVVAEEEGTYQATKHLIEKGHQHLLFFSILEKVSSAHNRLAGFQRAVDEETDISYAIENIQYRGLEPGLTDKAPVRKAIRKQLKKHGKIGIVCNHDGLASLAYDVCREDEIAVPGQVAIMGYGDEPSAQERGISTMHFSFEDMGMKAATILVDKIERRSRKTQQAMLASEMIIRETT